MKLASFKHVSNDFKVKINDILDIIYIEYNDTDNTYVLSVVRSGFLHNFTINEEMFKTNSKYTMFFSGIHGLCWLTESQLANSKEVSNIFGILRVYERDPICNLYFADSYENSMIFANKAVITNIKRDLIDSDIGNVWVHDYFLKSYPELYKEKYNNLVAKDQLNLGLHTVDAVVVLEQQLDIITGILISLLKENNLKTSFLNNSELLDFTNIYNNVSSLQYRESLPAALEKLNNERLSINNMKDKYFKSTNKRKSKNVI
jgi:hypothetical protein